MQYVSDFVRNLCIDLSYQRKMKVLQIVQGKVKQKIVCDKMIQIEIQEWQQMKAKLSRLEQQVIYLRNQNQSLKNKLNQNSNQANISSESEGNISISQVIKNKYSRPDLIVQFEDSGNSNLCDANDKPNSKYVSLNLERNSSVVSEGHDPESAEHESEKSPQQSDPNSITVTRKSNKEIELKNLITTTNKHAQNDFSNQLHLIEQICVFGPTLSQQTLQQITFKNDQKQLVQPTLYYPQNSSAYQPYGSYLFPKKCRVKPTQKSHITMEGNKIIFKSSKKPDCNIFIFQGNDILHPIKKPHEMLETVNPSKWLYGIVIEFSDFAFQEFKAKEQVKRATSEEELDEMYEMESPSVAREKRTSLLELNMRGFLQEQIRMETVSLKDIELQGEKIRMYRSTFCLCIFTYFPFVSYLQSIISAIFDEVKLKRIQRFPKTGEFKDCDIFCFIKEVDMIAKKIKEYFDCRAVKMGKQMTLYVNETELHMDLSREELYKQLYSNWAMKVIRMMDKETFYEIYCMVMLEESVMFVCEDQKLLSLIVLLFASMLTKPFIYPYPVVSMLFSEELLHTPFTSIVGVNQSQEWLQQAIQHKVIDSEHKHIIMVTEKQVKIRRTKYFTVPKSQRLRRIFTKFYKKNQPSSFSGLLLGKDSRLQRMNSAPEPNPKESTQHVLNFFAKLQIFYHENIFAYLPNNMKIQRHKTKPDEELNKVTMRNELLNEIEKEYKRVNPNYVRDQFIKEFVQTEIFSIYLINQYQLDV